MFNLLGTDDRKPASTNALSSDCDIQSVGYSIVERKNDDGTNRSIIRFAIKTFKPMTTWNACDLSILIDQDGDLKADQELLGAPVKNIPGETSEEFKSTLLNATLAREIRKKFEAEIALVKDDPVALEALKSKENYKEAILDQQEMILFNNSTVLIVEADLSFIASTINKELNLQVVLTHNDQSTTQMDDYLLTPAGQDFFTISSDVMDQSFVDLPEEITLFSAERTKQVVMTKGRGVADLLVLFPSNKLSYSENLIDAQSQVLKPVFEADIKSSVK